MLSPGGIDSPELVIVIIPCLNEEEGIRRLIPKIPRLICGVEVKLLLVDDGSSDRSSEVADDLGCDYIIRHRKNRGLARAFQTGISAAVDLGASYIVNIDADGQYRPDEIEILLAPLVYGAVDVAIGDRQTDKMAQFSLLKRCLQRLGSWTVSKAAGIAVDDAVSGFRAFTREAASRIAVLSAFSYTTETLISLAYAGFRIEFFPVNADVVDRPSRLARSSSQFVLRQSVTIVRAFWMERPLKFFSVISATFLILGVIPYLRFFYYYFRGDGEGYVQSLLIGGLLIAFSIGSFFVGIIGDLLSVNRKISLMILQRTRAGKYSLGMASRSEKSKLTEFSIDDE